MAEPTCACIDDEDARGCDADDCPITFRIEVGGPGPRTAREPAPAIEREDIPCDCWATLRLGGRSSYRHWSDCPELRRLRGCCDRCDLRPDVSVYHCPEHRGEPR